MTTETKEYIEPLTTSELFKKHFGNTCAVNLNHPNVENFFEELNQICKQEDLNKALNINP